VLAGGLWFAMGPDGALVGFVSGLIVAIIKRNKKTLFYSTKITFGDGNHVVVEHDRGEMRPFIRLTEDANTESNTEEA